MEVPFLDLVTPHAEMEAELVDVFRSALARASFIGGPLVEDFERDFAHFCGARYCIGVNSGTDALRFALIAAGVRPGDSVVTVANTFIATTEAISQAGAQPEFVDIDELTYNLDPSSLRDFLAHQCDRQPSTGRPISRCTGRPVTAVIPVHLYGQMADMDAIAEIAKEYGLLVIEDACQAHGSQYFSRRHQVWQKAGTIGKVAAFSFYPGKNLGACGEGGAVTTDDESIAKTIRQLRDHGQAQKYYHDIEGYNGRLDALQAGILGIKLRRLSGWNRQRRLAAETYRQLLGGMDGLTLPFEPSWSRGNYHLYVVRVPGREDFRLCLSSAGIGTGIHYPVPLHWQKAYARFAHRNWELPITEKVSAEIVSLPMFPQLMSTQQAYISEVIRSYFAGKASDSTALTAAAATA